MGTAGVQRKRAVEALCAQCLRHGVFLRGQVSFRVDPRGGGAACVANRFIPAGTRLMYLPVSSAFTPASLAAEFQSVPASVSGAEEQRQRQGQGEGQGGEGTAGVPWMEELRRAHASFEQQYQCRCAPRSPPCSQEFCFKKAVSGDKVRERDRECVSV
jgi:hypothetical protein